MVIPFSCSPVLVLSLPACHSSPGRSGFPAVPLKSIMLTMLGSRTRQGMGRRGGGWRAGLARVRLPALCSEITFVFLFLKPDSSRFFQGSRTSGPDRAGRLFQAGSRNPVLILAVTRENPGDRWQPSIQVRSALGLCSSES